MLVPSSAVDLDLTFQLCDFKGNMPSTHSEDISQEEEFLGGGVGLAPTSCPRGVFFGYFSNRIFWWIVSKFKS